MMHALEKHGRKITRQEIVAMTKPRYFQNDVKRLETLEALIISKEDPLLNRQDTGKTRTLRLYGIGRREFKPSNNVSNNTEANANE